VWYVLMYNRSFHILNMEETDGRKKMIETVE